MFIHDAILEAITCGNTQIPAGDMYVTLKKLRKKDPSTNMTLMESQFHVSFRHFLVHMYLCSYHKDLIPRPSEKPGDKTLVQTHMHDHSISDVFSIVVQES